MTAKFPLVALLLAVASTAGAAIDFAHEVLPILKERCAECHSNGKYKGGFSIDSREALLSSEAVVVGKAAESLMVELLTLEDPDERMPNKGKPLSADQVATLAKWVDEGLPWEAGFTFRETRWQAPLAPRKPDLPRAKTPDENPIDRIARGYFEKAKVAAPSAISDQQFLRRVSLDLLGLLPPTDEGRVFVNSTDKDKRSKKVAELLARDGDYADHWMSFWNDLLRNDYAGTGFIDGGRKQITGWLYQSLLANKPYDQFVRELLSPSGDSEGFIKGIKWRGNVNASQIPEVQYAQNVSQVFFGENLKCASCHDSFINDWKLADAYGMAAIIADKPLEMFRCDKPTGKTAEAKFLFTELGIVDKAAPKNEKLKQAAALATSPKNGRLARTVVNRIWARLMGRGMVEPVDIMGNQPWSEDMLDYIAWDLQENGYDLKRTLALMVNSQVYQSGTVTPPQDAEDYVFKGPIAKRMTAEQFIDAVWTITHSGPAKIEAKVKRESGAVRASLVKSTLLMRAMGRPNREQVVTTRPADLTTLQALELNNGAEFVGYLSKGSQRWHKKHAADPDALTAALYQAALARPPSETEQALALQILGGSPQPQNVEDLLWSVLMLPEFQMVR